MTTRAAMTPIDLCRSSSVARRWRARTLPRSTHRSPRRRQNTPRAASPTRAVPAHGASGPTRARFRRVNRREERRRDHARVRSRGAHRGDDALVVRAARERRPLRRDRTVHVDDAQRGARSKALPSRRPSRGEVARRLDDARLRAGRLRPPRLAAEQRGEVVLVRGPVDEARGDRFVRVVRRAIDRGDRVLARDPLSAGERVDDLRRGTRQGGPRRPARAAASLIVSRTICSPALL